MAHKKDRVPSNDFRCLDSVFFMDSAHPWLGRKMAGFRWFFLPLAMATDGFHCTEYVAVKVCSWRELRRTPGRFD